MMDNAKTEISVSTKQELSIGTRIGTGIVLGLGTAFIASYLMAGFLFFSSGQQPLLVRDIGSTTCGTYTVPDGGLNQPFVFSGQVDPDCSTPETGNDVCINGERPNCILAEPMPPIAVVGYHSGGWASAKFNWTTDTATSDNCLHYAMLSQYNPEPWRCIWGTGEPGCAGNLNTYCNGNNETSHTILKENLPTNRIFYYGVKSGSPGPELRSEVRWFHTNPTASTPTITQ